LKGLASLFGRAAGGRTVFRRKIAVAENAPFVFEGKNQTPAPITKLDPNFNIESKVLRRTGSLIYRLNKRAETNADALAVNVRFRSATTMPAENRSSFIRRF